MSRPKGSKNKSVEEIKSPVYRLEIKVGDIVKEYQGDNLYSLFKEYQTPPLFKAMTYINVSKDNSVPVSRVLNVRQATAVFGNKIALQLLANNLFRQL